MCNKLKIIAQQLENKHFTKTKYVKHINNLLNSMLNVEIILSLKNLVKNDIKIHRNKKIDFIYYLRVK